MLRPTDKLALDTKNYTLPFPLIARLTTCNKTHSGVLPQLRTLKAAEADKLVGKHETVCRWKRWSLTLARGTFRFETARSARSSPATVR